MEVISSAQTTVDMRMFCVFKNMSSSSWKTQVSQEDKCRNKLTENSKYSPAARRGECRGCTSSKSFGQRCMKPSLTELGLKRDR